MRGPLVCWILDSVRCVRPLFQLGTLGANCARDAWNGMADHALPFCENLIDWFRSVCQERTRRTSRLIFLRLGTVGLGNELLVRLGDFFERRCVTSFTNIEPRVHRSQFRQRQRYWWLMDLGHRALFIIGALHAVS